jgi:hypothetical protein
MFQFKYRILGLKYVLCIFFEIFINSFLRSIKQMSNYQKKNSGMDKCFKKLKKYMIKFKIILLQTLKDRKPSNEKKH